MNLKIGNYILYISVALLFFSGLFVRCANPAAPEGGLKDTLPPKILKIIPQNFSKNFRAQKVFIEFDEYVQLKDVQKEIVIAPPMTHRPLFTVKGKGVEIEFKCELDSATTYKIDFGTAIRDNNESNPLRNFAYVFSTGDNIDSLVMTGQLLDAYKGDTIIGGVVYLYDARADTLPYDSTLFIGRALSVARTDSNGVFIATNLKNMDYLVYAIADKNSNAVYDVGEDLAAFSDSLYNPANMAPFKIWYNRLRESVEATPQMILRAFGEKQVRRQALDNSKRLQRGMIQLYFAAPNVKITDFVIDNYDSTEVWREFNPTKDTLSVWIMQPDSLIGDSLTGSVSFMSLNASKEDTLVTKKINLYSKVTKRDNREKPKNPFNVKVEASLNMNPLDSIVFNFGVPIKEVLFDNILLEKALEQKKKERSRGGAPQEKEESKEELNYEKVKVEFLQDSISPRRWKLISDWVPASKYRLVIPEGTFTDILGNKNDSLGSDFETMDQEKMGMINFDVTTKDTVNSYVIEVITPKTGNVLYRKEGVTSGKYTIGYVAPGNYTIKVIKDVNHDGRWNSGELVNHVSPEVVRIFTDKDGGSIIEVKENWEINIEPDFDELFK